MLERLNQEAAKVMALAEDESRRMGHNFVGTEQILLGILADSSCIPAKVLASLGVYLKNSRVEVELIIGKGSGFVSKQVPLTPRAKRVMELAWLEANNLQNNFIGSEHLLLGLLREGEGVAARVLENLGVDDFSEVKTTLIQVVNGMDMPAPVEPVTKLESMDPEDSFRASDRDEALQNFSDAYSFLKSDAIKPEMLDWLEETDEVIGVYLNAEDDYLVLCENGIHWHSATNKSYVDYKSMLAVDLPEGQNERYVRIVLRPHEEEVNLPVLHETEDFADVYDLYEFLHFTLSEPALKMEIREIKTKDDLIYFLRQPNVRNNGLCDLATWLEQGAPKPSWLDALEISHGALQDTSVLRLMALILLRFPGCVGTE